MRRCAPLKPGLSMPPACLIWNSAVQKRISARRSWNCAREQAAARLMELVRQREPGLPPERLREQMPFEPVAPKQSQPSQSIMQRPPVQDRDVKCRRSRRPSQSQL